MRHSIWFTQSGMGAPNNSAGLAHQRPDQPPQRSPRRTGRMRLRALVAFSAMVILLMSIIELVAVVVPDGQASIPLGSAGVCISIALVTMLVVTRDRP